MFCKKCGKELLDGAKFCPACGENQESSGNQNSFNQGNGQNIVDLNQTINSFAEKNTDKLSEGEVVLVKAKWNIVPFILFWGLYFVTILFFPLGDKVINLIAIVPSAIVCAVSIWLFVVRRELIITNKKVFGRIGLIGTKSAVIPLNKIHYITIRYNIIGRLIRSGSFMVFPGTILGIAFRFVSNAEELKDTIENELYKN